MKHQTVNLVKFKALSRRLRIPLYRTVGILESLWVFAQIQARDGDLTRYSALDLAGWFEWDGDSDTDLIDALVETGWLDRDDDGLRIHGWDDHKPNWLKGAAASPRTKKRSLSETPSESLSAPPSATPTPSPPNLTQPNPTQPLETPTESLSPDKPDDAPLRSKFQVDWNGTNGVKRFEAWNEKRKTAFKARARDSKVIIDGVRTPWLQAFELAKNSKFPLQCTRGSPGGWLPDVDWMLKPDSLQHVFEGKYDWTKESKGVRPTDNSTIAANVGSRGL